MKRSKFSAAAKYRLTFAVVAAIIALAITSTAQADTIATFEDPTAGASGTPTPMFNIDFSTALVTGGWADTLTGLNLNVMGTTYTNAYFTMSDVTITNEISWKGQKTLGGTIKMYADGAAISSTPLVTITFTNAWITLSSYGASNFTTEYVAIECPSAGPVLTNDNFGFSFANQTETATGFTSTAAFTSSATTPEPATMVLLATGALISLRRRYIKVAA